ncbi:NAD(P)H-binding protein [Apilactobacillus xinyiensis]|uniref:NAD(P)H-binding protein n=1 Tax=Apilactobacillus xinyiensis TaxID=2841032 RepID=UPI0033652551
MRILIIGATGSIGRQLTNKLLDNESVSLRLFARHADKLNLDNERVEIVSGDANDIMQLKQAMQNVDRVFVALSGDLPNMINNIILAMHQMKVNKIVFIASMGIYNEIPANLGIMGNVKFNPMLIPYQKAAKLVEDSDLNYTIIRPAWFDNGNDEYEITQKNQAFKGGNVSRNAIADLARHALLDLNYANRQSLGINRPEI